MRLLVLINISNYKHISFDLDGTIIDSTEAMRSAWNLVRVKFKIKNSFNEYLKSTGKPFASILKSMQIHDPLGDIEKVYFDATSHNYEAISLIDGVVDLVEKLEGSGMSWSIITSKPRRNTIPLLDKFNLRPHCLVCGDDFQSVKPNPYPMRKVIKALNIARDAKIAYLGDTISDFIFSINANVDYIHVNYGVHGPIGEKIFPKPMSIDSLRSIVLSE